MLNFYSDENVSRFFRQSALENLEAVKEYKYLYKIQKNNIQYILNVSTKELAILSNITLDEVIENINSGDNTYKQELLTHNFIVGISEDSLEISKAISNKWQKKQVYDPASNFVRSYLIFTTTDCNARCFYCYEAGCKKEPMSIKTASELVKYMKRHHLPDSEIRLSWFGGEPLYNMEVIDYITSELKKENISYVSKMTSNSYLLNAETIEKAVNQWNLKSIQITLDGTKDVYNKIKNYIYNDDNAFETVINNIKLSANAGIRTRIRFNVSLTNIDDLLQLVEDLKSIWDEETRKKLGGYAHLLFQLEENTSDYSDDFIAKYELLEKNISELFFEKIRSYNNRLKYQRSCMTMNQHQVGVLPDGSLCTCEHFSEEEPWGSIFNDDTKPEHIARKWAEIAHLESKNCADCLYYPMCYYLAHCPACRQKCNPMQVRIKSTAIETFAKKMISKYKKSHKTKDHIIES